ncbi:hypothetical protein CBS101457_002772 [Exobasidium rhododendri]|nr:hypothetical protein CBS101457_002772 [Exobasidium rhododendri]
MDEVVARLVEGLLRRANETSSASHAHREERILVGLCGVPGSGKSQLARHVISRLNGGEEGEVAIVVGMDGWHLTRAQLEAMPDPQLARDKRGAAWTFDGKAFADFVAKVRSLPADATMEAPSFSHRLKDPIAGDIQISSHHRFVIFEGLYANINEGEWARAASMYDERWVVECDEVISRARLIVRHVATGVGKDEEEATWRADNNDIPNGRYLLQHVMEPATRIKSIEDILWKGAE